MVKEYAIWATQERPFPPTCREEKKRLTRSSRRGGVAETVSNIPNSRISTNPREGVVVELPVRAVTGRSVLGVGHTIEEASREALDLRDMAERFSD